MNEFEWDEAKNLRNIRDRGIDFEDAIGIFLGPTLEASDDRRDYGEERIIAYGETSGFVLAVVYTMRRGVCRIISARKANRHERNAYHAAVVGRTQGGADGLDPA